MSDRPPCRSCGSPSDYESNSGPLCAPCALKLCGFTLPTGALVRVVAPPHEGMIVCLEHLREIEDVSIYEEIPADQVSFWGHRCVMCGIDPIPDRLCENQDCRKPLHPRWPAVYCCNECALEDL